jgi:urea ABC transporter ATP-binding protein UrtE
MVLSVNNLSAGYGRVKIVQGVSFAVKPGEILAVIGRNGVGKSTLMKTLVGELPAMGGGIAFLGSDITGRPAHERAHMGVGYVPQGRGIFSRLSVGGNLVMGETVGRMRRLKANYERVYRFFPVLKERHRQMAGSFSGGQQQQLAIGRVLVGNPDLVLLDEPSEGIQPNIVQEIGRTIRRMGEEEGLTVIVVEQNLDLIRTAATRCIVMDKGAIVAEIDPQELDDPAVAKRYLAV